MAYRRLLLLSVLAAATAAGGGVVAGQTRRPPLPIDPPPPGREIAAADGDVIVVSGNDRVSVVRRRDAEVRVVVLAEQKAMLVIADWQGFEPDRGVDRVWRLTGVDGQWPLEPRWQGRVVLTEPDGPGVARAPLTLETPAGVVEFRGGGPRPQPPSSAAAVITFTGMSSGGQMGGGFDDAERQAMSGDFRTSMAWGAGATSAITAVYDERLTMGASGAAGGGVAGVVGSLPGTLPVSPSPNPARPGQLRVVRFVQPQWPAEAATAGVRGIVIVEVAVGLDGVVRAARVLRSVPMLDAAALAAARELRYAPAGPDERPDPTMVSVAYRFPEG